MVFDCVERPVNNFDCDLDGFRLQDSCVVRECNLSRCTCFEEVDNYNYKKEKKDIKKRKQRGELEVEENK